MPEAAKKNMHVPLPLELHEGLKEQAERLGAPATVLVREAVEEWVRRQKQAQIEEEIYAYAERMAGTDADLDTNLEEVGIEAWLENDA